MTPEEQVAELEAALQKASDPETRAVLERGLAEARKKITTAPADPVAAAEAEMEQKIAGEKSTGIEVAPQGERQPTLLDMFKGTALHAARGATGGLEDIVAQYPEAASQVLRAMPGPFMGMDPTTAQRLVQGVSTAQESALPQERRRELREQTPWWLSVPATIGGAIFPGSPASLATTVGRGLFGAATKKAPALATPVMKSLAGGATGSAAEGAMLSAADEREITPESVAFDALLGGILGPAFDVLGAAAKAPVRAMRRRSPRGDALQRAEKAGITTKMIGGQGATTPDYKKRLGDDLEQRAMAGENVNVTEAGEIGEMASRVRDPIALRQIDEVGRKRAELEEFRRNWYASPEAKEGVQLDETLQVVDQALSRGSPIGEPVFTEDVALGGKGAEGLFGSPKAAQDLAPRLFNLEVRPKGEAPAGVRRKEILLADAQKLGLKPEQKIAEFRIDRGRAAEMSQPVTTSMPSPQGARTTPGHRGAEETVVPPRQESVPTVVGGQPQPKAPVAEPSAELTSTNVGAEPVEIDTGDLSLYLVPKKVDAKELDDALEVVRENLFTAEKRPKPGGDPFYSPLERALLKDMNQFKAHDGRSAAESFQLDDGTTVRGPAAVRTRLSQELREMQNRGADAGLPRDQKVEAGELTEEGGLGPRRPRWGEGEEATFLDSLLRYKKNPAGGANKKATEALSWLSKRAGVEEELDQLIGLAARAELTTGAEVNQRFVYGAGQGVSPYGVLSWQSVANRIDPIFRAFQEESSSSLKRVVDSLVEAPQPKSPLSGAPTTSAMAPRLRGGHAGARVASGAQVEAGDPGALPEDAEARGEEVTRRVTEARGAGNPYKAVLADLLRARFYEKMREEGIAPEESAEEPPKPLTPATSILGELPITGS